MGTAVDTGLGSFGRMEGARVRWGLPDVFLAWFVRGILAERPDGMRFQSEHLKHRPRGRHVFVCAANEEAQVA